LQNQLQANSQMVSSLMQDKGELQKIIGELSPTTCDSFLVPRCDEEPQRLPVEHSFAQEFALARGQRPSVNGALSMGSARSRPLLSLELESPPAQEDMSRRPSAIPASDLPGAREFDCCCWRLRIVRKPPQGPGRA